MNFATKHEKWREHLYSVRQRLDDEAAEREARHEQIWSDDTLLLAAIRYAGQDDILIGDAIAAYEKRTAPNS